MLKARLDGSRIWVNTQESIGWEMLCYPKILSTQQSSQHSGCDIRHSWDARAKEWAISSIYA